MRWQDYLDIALAPDKATFRRRMIDFAHWMDFPFVGAVLVTEGSVGPNYKYVGNKPQDFVASSDPRLLKMDPVVAQLRGSSAPFPYDQEYYADAGVPELWEMAAPYGFRTGISTALQVSASQRLLVGLDRERALPGSNRKLQRLLTDLDHLAPFLVEGALRFAVSSPRGPEDHGLTDREREILLRVLEGRSNWVISQMLSVSENTIKFHLKNVFKKLEVSSRIVAATKAHLLGLI